MTRKDYVAMAEVVKATTFGTFHHDEVTGQVKVWNDDVRSAEFAGRVADVFAADNPRFDRGRFMAACGLAS